MSVCGELHPIRPSLWKLAWNLERVCRKAPCHLTGGRQFLAWGLQDQRVLGNKRPFLLDGWLPWVLIGPKSHRWWQLLGSINNTHTV